MACEKCKVINSDTHLDILDDNRAKCADCGEIYLKQTWVPEKDAEDMTRRAHEFQDYIGANIVGLTMDGIRQYREQTGETPSKADVAGAIEMAKFAIMKRITQAEEQEGIENEQQDSGDGSLRTGTAEEEHTEVQGDPL